MKNNTLKNTNKKRIRLIALGMASITLFFQGCQVGNNKNDKGLNKNFPTISRPYRTTSQEDSKSDTSSDKLTDNLQSDTIIPLKNVSDSNRDFKTNIEEKNYNEFIKYIEGNQTYYKYSDLYLFEENLNEYNSLVLEDNHNSKLKELDSKKLYNIVKENNKKYCEQKYIMQKNNMDDSKLKEICNVIIEVSKYFVEENLSISEERLKCVLGNLKVFNKASFNNAYVTDDNCLILSSNMIDFADILVGDKTERKTLIHEIIHLLQKGCDCDTEYNNLIHNYGFSYNFKRTDDTSLDFSWLYEASAEKNMCNYLNTQPMTYKNMIGYLESLSLVNLVKDNYKVNDTEKLSFSHDLNTLFNFFDAKTDSEKYEILELMYSIEVMQKSPSAFKRIYKSKYNETIDDGLLDTIRYELKYPICKTLSKVFYKNLIKEIKNKNIELKDVFYLISVFECDINNHITYDQEAQYKYNQEFLKDYVEIQDNFFYALAMSNNLKQEEVEELFMEYTSKTKDNNNNIVNNYSLNWLGQSKIQYIDERLEAIKDMKSYNIRNAYNYSISKNNTYKIQN